MLSISILDYICILSPFLGLALSSETESTFERHPVTEVSNSLVLVGLGFQISGSVTKGQTEHFRGQYLLSIFLMLTETELRSSLFIKIERISSCLNKSMEILIISTLTKGRRCAKL